MVLLGSLALFSFCWTILIQRYQADYPWRRRFIALSDITMLAYAMHLTGELGTMFYFLYLWIIVGNGMRFGARSLLEVMLMGLVGLCFVIANSEYWLANIHVAIGLFMGLIILPLFYLNLIKRLHFLNEKLNEELGKVTYAAGPMAWLMKNASSQAVAVIDSLHALSANFTVALVAIHVGGVLWESLLHRENLIKSMFTGYKPLSPGGPSTLKCSRDDSPQRRELQRKRKTVDS